MDRRCRNPLLSYGELIPLFRARKKAIARRILLRMYRHAWAQAHGQPIRGRLTSPIGLLPEELLSTLTASLANMDGEEQAARQLGLTAAEVAAHREHARQIHLREYLRLRLSGDGPGSAG